MSEDLTVKITPPPPITINIRPGGARGPAGADGEPGPAGPSAVSADAGNAAVLGTDDLIYVPASTGGASNWGDLGGTLSDQTDLQAALDAKADTTALGTAATHAATDFATAAQGALADTALQSAPVASVNGHTGVVVLSASDVGAAPTGAYVKPAPGIPSTDMTTAVQTSLGKADTALQSAPVTSVNTKTGAVTLSASDVGASPTGAYVKPGTGIPSSDMTTAVQTSLGKADTALQSGDITGKLDTSAAPELIRDTIGTALVAGTNVTITVNDAGDTITIDASGGSAKSVQHDTSGGFDYTGVAAQGTSTSSSGWTITRTDLSSPSTAAKHATGAWTSRTSLTYS